MGTRQRTRREGLGAPRWRTGVDYTSAGTKRGSTR